MSDFQDPDEIIDVLRGPATAAELSGEAATVALMAQAHNAGGRTTMHSTSRRARVATLIAAGIIGFGGVAAAGGVDQSIDMDAVNAAIEEPAPEEPAPEEPAPEEPAPEEPAPEEPAPEEPAPEEPAPEEPAPEEPAPEEPAAEEPAPEEPAVEEPAPAETEDRDNPETAFDENDCAKDGEGNELNHGKTVSGVAKGDIPGNVVDAAHSDCGKKNRAVVESDEDEPEPEPVIVEEQSVVEDDSNDSGDADASSTRSAGNSGKEKPASNGNGKANGKKGGK